MNTKSGKRGLIAVLVLAAIVAPLLYGQDVFAAGELSPGRRLWNNILLWVNFGILVFLFIKFGRKPLLDHLRGVREKVKGELDDVKTRFQDAKSLMDAEEMRMKEIEGRLEEIRGSILELGRREKGKIIEDGKIAAERIILNAKDYATYRIEMARKRLKNEMLDLAFGMVEDRLSKGISEEENEKLVNQFLKGLTLTKLGQD